MGRQLIWSQRIFQYAEKWDFLVYAAGTIAAIGAGITIPLLNIVFGKSKMRWSWKYLANELVTL